MDTRTRLALHPHQRGFHAAAFQLLLRTVGFALRLERPDADAPYGAPGLVALRNLGLDAHQRELGALRFGLVGVAEGAGGLAVATGGGLPPSTAGGGLPPRTAGGSGLPPVPPMFPPMPAARPVPLSTGPAADAPAAGFLPYSAAFGFQPLFFAASWSDGRFTFLLMNGTGTLVT